MRMLIGIYETQRSNRFGSFERWEVPAIVNIGEFEIRRIDQSEIRNQLFDVMDLFGVKFARRR